MREIVQYEVKVKVKVSHSLLAIGAVGVRVPLYLGHSIHWVKGQCSFQYDRYPVDFEKNTANVLTMNNTKILSM